MTSQMSLSTSCMHVDPLVADLRQSLSALKVAHFYNLKVTIPVKPTLLYFN